MEDGTPLIRTDFSDDRQWNKLIEMIDQEEEMGFRAYTMPVSDRRFEGATPEIVAKAAGDALVVFMVDQRALKDHEILCIDTEDPSQRFRAKITELASVENNLSLANMGIDEFIRSLDSDGVFAGFA